MMGGRMRRRVARLSLTSGHETHDTVYSKLLEGGGVEWEPKFGAASEHGTDKTGDVFNEPS